MSASAARRPRLLLDVDGVLAVVREALDDEAADAEATLHPEAAAWIAELAGAFELAWATTWHELANRLIARRAGLAPLPAVPLRLDHGAPTPKLPSVIAFVGDRPCAWVDDDLHEDADTWAAGREVPTLLVHVASAEGMTRQHVDRLLAWAEALTEG